MLALYLFGPPRCELDKAPVHISRRKAMALLAYCMSSAQLGQKGWFAKRNLTDLFSIIPAPVAG
jgi:hypothetical protein